MDVRCKHCNSINRLSDQDGVKYCSNCGMKLDPAGSSALPKSGNSIYVPCPYCKNGFYVPADTTVSHAPCSHCKREVDLCQGGETLVMGSLSASEVMPAISIQQEQLAMKEKARQEEENTDHEMLGNYRIESLLTTTCLGTIHLGTQVNLNRPVMVYMLDPVLTEIPDCAETFVEQARLSAGFVHANVARVYDVAMVDKKQFMVSELVRGRQLLDLVKNDKPLSCESALLMTAVIARALAAAHGRGLLHLGLSPENIFITDPGQAKLMHFGVMKAFAHAGAEGEHNDIGITFYAPEFIAGKEIDSHADLFSLGASVFFSLTGRPPYSRERALRIIRGDVEADAPDIKAFRPDIPPAFADVLSGLIQPDPSHRPFRGEDLVKQVEKILQAPASVASTAPRPGSKTPAGLAPPSPEARRRYKRLPAALNVQVERQDVDQKKLDRYRSKLKNVSENGAFVLTQNPLPPGTFVNLNFALAKGGSQVHAVGIVRWQDNTPGQVGMGVQFIEVSTVSRENLSRYVDERTARESLSKLQSSALHKAILRYVVKHFGDSVAIEQMMKGTGASRMLFERAIKDFVDVGLVEVKNGDVNIRYPENEAMLKAIEQILNIVH